MQQTLRKYRTVDVARLEGREDWPAVPHPRFDPLRTPGPLFVHADTEEQRANPDKTTQQTVTFGSCISWQPWYG